MLADSAGANEKAKDTSTSTDAEAASSANSGQNFVRFPALQLPLDPDVKICGVIPKQATLFKSSLMPARLTFITDKGKKNIVFILNAKMCMSKVIKPWKGHLWQPNFSKGLTKSAILTDYKRPRMLCLVLLLRGNLRKLDFQSEFFTSKIIQTSLIFSLKIYSLGAHFC